jgi:ankyrin repeat protein
MTWRVADGFTALHIAAWRGEAAMVKTLLEKSEANEEEEARREDERKAAKKPSPKESKEANSEIDNGEDDDDEDMVDDSDSDDSHAMTESSFVKVREEKPTGETMPDDSNYDEPDVFDVNVLAWDAPLSPLHCAIMRGHIEVIELLVQNFRADALLPVKLTNRYNRDPRAAILTLVLALQPDQERSKAVTKKLLYLGASLSQADMDQNTALHYAVKEGNMGVLDILFEFDEQAARNAINHLSVPGNTWYSEFSSPLVTAIRERNINMVDKLLDLGAEPMISFESYMRSWQRKNDKVAPHDPTQNKTRFEKTVEQPITIAAQLELPMVVRKLLAKGADCNTMTKQGYERLSNPSWRRTAETILDIVRNRLRKLREYIGEKNKEVRPGDLETDSHYLSGLQKGTYKEWAARGDLQQAKAVHDAAMKKYAAANGREEEGGKMKMVKIQELIKDLEETKEDLLKRGAKKFSQLHPELEDSGVPNPPYQHRDIPEMPFKIGYQFFVPDLTDTKKDGYLQL